MNRIKRSIRSRTTKVAEEPKNSSPDPNKTSNNPTLAIRTSNPKRVRREGSTRSLASTSSASRAARASKKARQTSAQHLQVPQDENQNRESSAESYSDPSVYEIAAAGPSLSLEQDPEDSTRKPPWTVRHRIYLDNELISCTTSAQRAGYHKFADFLLREQIETRLYHASNGRDAHFATRHAVLRFWKRDGTLAEKWMDKDWGGEKEHEFAMENMNDWTILHLSMGGGETPVEQSDEETKVGSENDQTMDDAAEPGANEVNEDAQGEDAEQVLQDEEEEGDEGALEGEVEDEGSHPTMDITSHYLSDYDDARSISGAPGSGVSGPSYHWVEERRRDLEHQLREWYHCTEPTCFNKGGTCIAISQSQHLHVDVKDLTDWSQMIAHANRSIAATTLHLAAKLVDDQVRAQDERLADVGRERDDEDDLGEVLRLQPVLASLRPSQDAKAELDPLD